MDKIKYMNLVLIIKVKVYQLEGFFILVFLIKLQFNYPNSKIAMNFLYYFYNLKYSTALKASLKPISDFLKYFGWSNMDA